jgi:hypothetical protein
VFHRNIPAAAREDQWVRVFRTDVLVERAHEEVRRSGSQHLLEQPAPKTMISYVLKRSPYVRPEPVLANDCVATRKIRNRDQVFVPLQCETTEVAWVREGEGGLCRHVGA